MRDPDLIHKSYELEIPEGIIKIVNVPEYRIWDYDLADEKSMKIYIEDIKRDVRSCFEYRQMIMYLRDYLDMNQCAFFANVSNADSTKIRIEIHHEPLSLHDIVIIVINKRTDFGESLEVEDVSREVMYLHYQMMVGLIPLSITVHELVHNQYLFIPTTAVFGKYQEFINRYREWMLPEQLEMIDRIEQFTKEGDYNDYKDILARHYIYMDLCGDEYQKHTNKEILSMIKERIGDIIKP